MLVIDRSTPKMTRDLHVDGAIAVESMDILLRFSNGYRLSFNGITLQPLAPQSAALTSMVGK